ncbi:hypothetical protein [Streptomyces solincola]|nr:hypothetical protein [Streptomyces solincola]
MKVGVGGKEWTPGDAPTLRTVRLSPDGTARDADTGTRLTAPAL